MRVEIVIWISIFQRFKFEINIVKENFIEETFSDFQTMLRNMNLFCDLLS